MFFFEGKIELYNILFLLVIPVGVPVLMFFSKRKSLWWFSPFATIIIGLVLTAVFYPYFFTDLLTGSNEIGGGGSWVLFTVPIHLIVTIVTTAILYGIKKRLPDIKPIDDILTIDSPTKGIMRVRVEQKKSGEISYTLVDGISAGYGFSSIRMGFRSKGNKRSGGTLPPISKDEMYNAAKDFIEQLGPSGYLDDGQ